MAPARKTAAQKAAEAAERDEYTGTGEPGPEPETEAAPAEPAKPKKGESIQQLKNRLRNEAERDVLNNHKDEVIQRTQAKYDEHGLEYVRRLTDEEKAAKTIEEMYRKFPNLRPVTVVQADPLPREEPVPAVPGGPLATFRAGDYEYVEEPDNYRDVEAREGE